MNDIIDIEIILKRKKYPKIYNTGTIILIVLISFIYISTIYQYKTYYIQKGTVEDGNIKLLVKIDDIKYIGKNNALIIDKQLHEYTIYKISEEIYVDEFYNNYKYVYLKVNNISDIDNYVYEVKIEKENKQLIKYLIEYV